RTRAVIIADSDHVILSAVQPETVAHRLGNLGGKEAHTPAGAEEIVN
ncbi:MAG TPA: hypothetical protein DCK87_08925, partial [Desulfotomaculum sp.]|nr:hypothetical protein [Desulfotomaculum sp.]